MGIIHESTAAKRSHIVLLPVRNWLKTAQRFRVTVEPDQDASRAHFFRGADLVDVPALNDRDYKLAFYGYTKGMSKAAVKFTNENTGEYLVYSVEVEVTEPGVVGVIPLFAPVRQSVAKIITLENPLPSDDDVAFEGEWWKCDDPNVRVRKISPVAGCAEGTFEVEYRPLVLTNVDGNTVHEKTLTLTSAALGDYKYTLRLKATPAGTERSMHFKASLGSEHVQSFRFRNFLKHAEEYECKVTQPLFFEVVPLVKAEPASDWSGSEVIVEIRFEPQALGPVRDTLTISSGEGGTYVCTLHGVCDPPRPQGPYNVQPGKDASIQFKNVFNEVHEFNFVVDNSDFAVSGQTSQKVEARKATTVSIKYSGQRPSSTGKLFVSCSEMPHMPPWIYYLKGQHA